MRKANPDTPRPFKTPMVGLVSILGVLVCSAMIVGLDKRTLMLAFGWMIMGLVVYFLYSKSHSNLQRDRDS